jgi:tetratricopeptide (TPR) repeat protein
MTNKKLMPKQKKSDRERLRQLDLLFLTDYRLGEKAVAKLERTLIDHPNNLECRLKLLSYYFGTCHRSRGAAKKQFQLISWMIRNMPDHEVLRCPHGHMEDCNPSRYKKYKDLWLQQIAKYDDNVNVIINAASSLKSDSSLAEKLYRKAITLDPQRPDWCRDLAWMLRLSARKNSPKMKRALVAMEEAVRKAHKTSEKRYLYDDLAEIAYDVGDWSVAQKMARKSLSLVGKLGENWYDGNALHDGNCILGRLALRKGQINKALFHLKAASQTDGSPQLDSFGPNMDSLKIC